MNRYWLYFDVSMIYPRFWPPAVSVTGQDLDDCLEIVRHQYGQLVPPMTRVVEDPDLTDFQPGGVPGGWSLGVPVWRGVWYPPENITGPGPRERQRSHPRWWALRERR